MPSEKKPTSIVHLRVSLFSHSMTLTVRIRVQCSDGKSQYVNVSSDFAIMPYCNSDCMNTFLCHLSAVFSNDYIVLVCDGTAWNKSKALVNFPNIELIFIPAYTPEINPIEHIWKELRTRRFNNEAFLTLAKVVERLCKTIRNLTSVTICSITARNWIIKCIN